MASKEHEQIVAAVVEGIRAERGELRAHVAALRSGLLTPGKVPESMTGVPASALPEQLVTLDQIAAMVHRSKRSLERYSRRMPRPRVRGRRGQPHLWSWPEVRPWLEETFGLPLPERFPRAGH